jgi:arylsulfatase A-like enzyme
MSPQLHLLFLSLILTSCAPRKQETAITRPNIIYIMTDDHAVQALSAYGSRINSTPNLDRIAQNGMRLDNVFCTNSICAPSRAVILTGKHSHLNGVLNNTHTFDGSQQTFPKLLQQAGYQTAMIGKWHLKSHPTGFDYWNVLPGQGLYYNPDFIEMGEPRKYTGYVTDLTTDFALQWLDTIDRQRPFMLVLQHKAPHRNWMPNIPDLYLYDDVDIPYPETLFDDYATRSDAAREQEMTIARHMHMSYDLKVWEENPTGNNWDDTWMNERLKTMTPEQREAFVAAYGPKNEAFRNAGLQGEELLKWKYQRYIKDYLRTIKSVDDNVGRVLDYLEANGLAENTIVIYTSDQGFYLGEHGWYDKRFMYEESYRMPFLIQYPGVIPVGSTLEAICMNIDFAPTILDLAGVEIPGDMQGQSFRPALAGKGEPAGWRQSAYYHYFEYPGVHAVKRHYGVRTKRHKLIHFYYDIDAWELYDLEKDPRELNNVFDNPAYAKIVEDLQKELRRLQELYKDDPEQFRKGLDRDSQTHLGLNLPAKLSRPTDKPHDRDPKALTDGKMWSYSFYASQIFEGWLGFQGDDFEVVLDLGASAPVSGIGLNCMQNPDSWIYYPQEVRFYVSENGTDFREVGKEGWPENDLQDGIKVFQTGLDAHARYIKVVARPRQTIPEGQPGGGEKGWLFVDEVIVM